MGSSNSTTSPSPPGTPVFKDKLNHNNSAGILKLRSCNICFEPYNNLEKRKPRNLPCGHTNCSNCAEKLLKNGSLCPICRVQFDVMDVNLLSINYDLIQINEEISNECTKLCKDKRMIMKIVDERQIQIEAEKNENDQKLDDFRQKIIEMETKSRKLTAQSELITEIKDKLENTSGNTISINEFKKYEKLVSACGLSSVSNDIVITKPENYTTIIDDKYSLINAVVSARYELFVHKKIDGCEKWGSLSYNKEHKSFYLSALTYNKPMTSSIIVSMDGVLKLMGTISKFYFIDLVSNEKIKGRIIVRMLDLAPNREKQFDICCTGQTKNDFLYLEKINKKIHNLKRDTSFTTTSTCSAIVDDLETGGACNLSKKPGLIRGFDNNTDFSIFCCSSESSDEPLTRCFAEIKDGKNNFISKEQKNFIIKNCGIIWTDLDF